MPRKKEAFEAMRENTRNKIDDVALSLFARIGLSITMDEIAKTAGLSKGLLYCHYNSKEELISEFINRATRTSAQIIKDVKHSELSTATKIKQIITMMCSMLAEQPKGIEYFMFMIQVDLNGFKIHEDKGYTLKNPDPIGTLAEIIEQGQREGSVVSGNGKELSTTFWAMIQGLCCYVITDKYIPIDAKVLSRILLKSSGNMSRSKLK